MLQIDGEKDKNGLLRFKIGFNILVVLVSVGAFFLTVKSYDETQEQNSKRNLIDTDVKEKYKMLDNLLVETKAFTENEFLYQLNNSDYEVRNKYFLEMSKARMGIVANLDKKNSNYNDFLKLTTRLEDRSKDYQEAKAEGKQFLPFGTVGFLENKIVEAYFKEERQIINELISNK